MKRIELLFHILRRRQRLPFVEIRDQGAKATKMRRVRQRIEYANPYVELDLTSEGSTPQKASVVQAGSEGRDDDDTGMARVLERRLELDIMTQSEVGLSAEAKEYLRLQRRLILQNLKEKTLDQPWQ
ncbi:hypothetical protein GN958_ATG09538 [Phytophthora infestans]|uniref:Uncharacterized protein n=1 Tax=Phytophthora infestans TaxID=4787 RepID=A0A8S9UL70_PHYIN|nr:hypothetical protein GN958_ATG09538 [Phytophthora infestans]